MIRIRIRIRNRNRNNLSFFIAVSSLIGLTLFPSVASEGRKCRYTLTWADEFKGPKGSRPDAGKWSYETGGGGFGNKELESYTDRRENSYLDGHGDLVIKALRETFTAHDGIKRQYTSARLVTKGKFSQRYGRFEARLKLPYGQGIWPAFWMMGDSIDQVGWPNCGEIDIMENIGREPGINHGSLHGPGYCGGQSLTGTYKLPGKERLCDRFHTYAIEWEPETIRFYFDGHLYHTMKAADIPGKRWAFDSPFFILLNVAVGGNWPGSPDETTSFPQVMLVDYVRAYEKAG